MPPIIVACLCLLALVTTVKGSFCPGSANKDELNQMISCSRDIKSNAEWGKCLQCNDVCTKLQSFNGSCLLGYGQVLHVAIQETCDLESSICSTPFGSLLNATCTEGLQLNEPCAPVPLIAVIAGTVAGAFLLCVVLAVVWEYRRRKRYAEKAAKKQRRAERKARENGQQQQKWRPSFIKRTKAMMTEVNSHQSARLSSGSIGNSSLSPMSSAGAPPLPSHGSFRSPPPGAPPNLVSHNSFRGPPSGAPPAMVPHNSFRGAPPLNSHNSFRGSSSLKAKGSFRGPPPIETHPQFAQLQQQGLVPSHNSFHGAPPQLQAHNSFHGAPPMQPHNSFHGAPPQLQAHNSFHGAPPMMAPPGVMPVSPGPVGAPPLPPPSRNSNALTAPAPGLPPAVPPSRNSGAITQPAASRAPSSGGEAASDSGGGGGNDLLAQIKLGKQLKKVAAPEEKKEEVKKPAGGGGGGGAGGLMAELQMKMKKKAN